MDEKVIAAMARWPDVPAVYGWLSLSERGNWRLHPAGDALADADAADPYARQGASISSPQILQFMNRNYGRDEIGRWFFQNGPQKVYVRLDAAPYIANSGNPDGANFPTLHTHTGLQVARVESWWLTDAGRLYAQTDLGAALVIGRDLDVILTALITQDGQKALDALDGFGPDSEPISVRGPAGEEALLSYCAESALPAQLGFVRLPKAD